MSPSSHDSRARGIAMRQARMSRVSGIRRRVVASALALFVATWLLITMLLISGHDPALARTATNSAAAATTTTSTAASNPTGTSSTTAASTATSSSSNTSSLTSSQS